MRSSKFVVTCAVFWVALLAGGGAISTATLHAFQPEHQPVKEGAVAEGHPAEGEHEEGILPTVARVANFAILVGLLFYFLRTPLAGYLRSRSEQIRSEILEAADMRRTAEAQLAGVDRQMRALPGELEALRARGAHDVAAEEARIRAATEAERARLLEHMQRDMDMQVRIARRALTEEAAALATEIARARIEKAITPEDQARLLDRYAAQLEATA